MVSLGRAGHSTVRKHSRPQKIHRRGAEGAEKRPDRGVARGINPAHSESFSVRRHRLEGTSLVSRRTVSPCGFARTHLSLRFLAALCASAVNLPGPGRRSGSDCPTRAPSRSRRDPTEKSGFHPYRCKPDVTITRAVGPFGAHILALAWTGERVVRGTAPQKKTSGGFRGGMSCGWSQALLRC